MALAFFFALLAQRVSFVGDELDAETLERMRERAVFLQEQMTLQWQHVENVGQRWMGIRAFLSSVLPYWKVYSLLERMREVFLREQKEKPLQLEERNLEKSRVDIQALLFSVLPYWKVCSVLCILFLFLWFMWKIYKKFQRTEDISDEESSISEEKQQEQEEKQEEVEKEDLFFADLLWPVESHESNCRQMHLLFSGLINICKGLLVDTFYPVPEHPIGVGSTYEDWSPPENVPVYCLLVPLKAPRGHVFHLDLGTPGELPARNSRIRVDLECTCGREQEMGMQCFLHTAKKQLGKQRSSLLHELCTDSYLDTEKTVFWFEAVIKDAWERMCLPKPCRLYVEARRRSCRLTVTDRNKRENLVNILFGVQQDNTDIFLNSQEIQVGRVPSTTWPQTCAVAEVKFFQHIAAHAEEYNFYVRYMQVAAYIRVGLHFYPYEMKTVLMHLLTAIPLESWKGRYFLLRVDDIVRYLRCCVEEKRLNHFFIGNEDVPAEIILPQEFRASQPLNLFQHLVQDPDRHEQALQDVEELQDRLASLLIYGK